jgi:hypothetical protein
MIILNLWRVWGGVRKFLLWQAEGLLGGYCDVGMYVHNRGVLEWE